MGWFSKKKKGFKPKITKIEPHDLFNQLVPLVNPDLIDMRYEGYPYLLPDDPYAVMSAVPTWKIDYDDKYFNCNDFMREFRGWLSRHRIGRLVAMEVGIKKKNNNKHLLVGFLHKGELLFGEPQSGKIVRLPDGAKIEHIII